ncbi:MAG: UvrB/UvrC motif-containing protein [Oscillospiraceae bacterium]|jgi:protein arginine kinase activator|nr:UvrB/UvrC motif-containing protein [Oscillospiraceae bacterium]
MKCEKCDKEAVFHYQSDMNGEKTECHLCADCARAEGYGEMLGFRTEMMASSLSSFFSRPFGGLMSGLFGAPFGSLSTLPDSFLGRRFLVPFPEAPGVNIAAGETAAEKATESGRAGADNIPKDAGGEFRKKRELHMLQHQLRNAVRAEEFEKAAELRDKIRAIEK